MNSKVNKALVISAISLIVVWLIVLTIAVAVTPKNPVSSENQLPLAAKPTTEKPVSITWYGHNAFKLTCETKNVLIDPWITRNPQSPIKVEETFPVELILVSDGHAEHVGDTITIAKKTGAKVLTTPDIAAKLIADGLPAENVLYEGSGINIGGHVVAENIDILMTPTVHASTVSASTSYIIKFPGGATVYYAGNTGIFADMQLLAGLYPIHVALLPIGGISSMDAWQAVQSLKLLKPAKVIPMQFGALPNITQNADEFLKLAMQGAPDTEVIILKPGQSYILKPGTYR